VKGGAVDRDAECVEKRGTEGGEIDTPKASQSERGMGMGVPSQSGGVSPPTCPIPTRLAGIWTSVVNSPAVFVVELRPKTGFDAFSAW